MIQIKEAERFFALQSGFEYIPFTQSEGWYNYHYKSWSSIVFFIDRDDDPKIALWGREYSLPALGKKILRIEGESYTGHIKEDEFRQFYKDLTEIGYWGIEINSNNPYYIEYEIGLRRAGFKRPLSLFYSPLTIEIDLGAIQSYNRNWRRNIKKGIKVDLCFSEINQVNEDQVNDIVSMFREMAELKHLKYDLEPESITKLISSKDIRTFIVKDKKDKVVAARIIHECNQYATDIYAANSIVSRECGASFFIMDGILSLLKEEGKMFFDFGRIPPSNHKTDSVYIFKKGSGGNAMQYNGEWMFYKKKWIELALFVYKALILKKQRY